jgi:TRAP-type C4-dicarboxylate transport system substrate-binding protein
MTARSGWGAKAPLATVVVVAGLALTGCAGGSGAASGGGGEGLPAGATKEQFIAAFEDVEPIHLYTQTPAPKGAASGQNLESYVAQIEEWSGGKITFDVAYSNAVAAPTEIDDALNDGRLDLANVLPLYEPSDYPATNALIDAGVLNNGSPVVGVLQTNAWANEVAFSTQEIMDEWDQHGLVPLVPIYDGGPIGLFCAQEQNSLDSLRGKTIATSTPTQSHQVESLGGSPVSIVYTEFFESLQRGVVDCVVANGAGAVLAGLVPEAPHVVIDPEARFATTPGGLAFSQSKWETLPLVAQQLLWDRLSVYVEENVTVRSWPIMAEMAGEVRGNDGSFITLDDSARAAMLEANEGVLNDIRASSALDGQALVDDSTAAAEKWTEEVKTLGFDPDVDHESFPEWLDGKVDLSGYTDKVMTDVFGPHRPQ